MKYFVFCFALFCFVVSHTQAQKYILNTKEVSAILNIEPYNKGDSNIKATIMITNHTPDMIYLPEMNSMENVDYFFFLRGESLYFYAGVREFFFGINEPGIVEINMLPSNRTKSYSISIKNNNQWGKMESTDINEIVFRVEYLPNINPNIIWKIDNKTTIKGSTYVELFKVLRLSVPYKY